MSTKPRIYLDHNATSPLVPSARAAIEQALELVGNPSSVHAEGRRARDVVERARNEIASLVGRPREQVVFTSGGTEANLSGVLGLARAVESRGGARVVASAATDHPSLRGAVAALVARGWDQRELAVAPDGSVAIGDLTRVGLVTATLVNHEIGTVLDHPRLAAAARAAGAMIHLDVVQAAGKLGLADVDADALALSAHKLGGPAGVGALVVARDDGLPLVEGGHQERGRRPGTENLVGIAGFGAAAASADVAGWTQVVDVGEQLEAGLRAIPGCRIHGDRVRRVGGTINAGFAGALGESIVVALDLAGIATSTGAACTSGSIQPSAVLLALGQSSEKVREAVRFSLGRSTTREDIEAVLAVLPAIVARAAAGA